MDDMNVTTEIVDLSEARKLLPRVRRRVAKLMEITRRIRETEAAVTEVLDLPPERLEALRDLAREFRHELKALNELGAYLKDPATGLVDFYTWRDGDMAFLCWRHGESDIGWWHGLHEGFGCRKPL